MNWFEQIFGFSESTTDVYQNLQVEGEYMTSLVNQQTFRCGRLDIPTLKDVRQKVGALPLDGSRTMLREVVGHVQNLHADSENHLALFQVASQCNLLEMVGPGVTPEQGITGYFYDRTQGPACAMAAAAGTVYRNYFVPLGQQVGQTATLQVDTMQDLHTHLGGGLWDMRNGYCLPSRTSLDVLNERYSTGVKEEWMSLLRIGIHWNTEVTMNRVSSGHLVHQAYCSAMPVGYSRCSVQQWENLGRLVLEAAYLHTLYAAVQNLRASGVNKVYLTLLGGGVFGNPTNWIIEAIWKALQHFEYAGLDVAIVSYGQSNPHVQDLIEAWTSQSEEESSSSSSSSDEDSG